MELLIFWVVATLAVLMWLLVVYNRFVALRQHLRESWADIDVELKRRYDLIPNLVAVVQGYVHHERAVFERVASLRAVAVASNGSAGDQARDEERLCLGLREVFAIAEANPVLRADAQFQALQRELAQTEDRIAAARRFFNGNVRDLNRLREQFPTNLVARAVGVAPASYFELSEAAERVVPRVVLGA